ITFVVILITLVGQGLLLPFIVKWLNMKEIDDIASEEEQVAAIQLQLSKVSLNYLTDPSKIDLLEKNELLANFKIGLENDVTILEGKIASLICDETEKNDVLIFHQQLKEIYTVQRNELARLRNDNLFTDEILRKQAERIDLSEAQISNE